MDLEQKLTLLGSIEEADGCDGSDPGTISPGDDDGVLCGLWQTPSLQAVKSRRAPKRNSR
jgi:hypothetical protein